MQGIDYLPAADLLGHSAPLEYGAEYPLLGVRLAIRSNSAAVIACAEQSFGHWRAVAASLIAPLPLRVARIVVHAGVQPYTPRAPFTPRAHSGSLLAASGESLLAVHMEHGSALAFVTPDLVADTQHFRYHVLESMALALTSWHDRVPIHAGAVVRNGRAVLLAGQSTAGKSTLCYACVRDQFQLLAEDVIYLSSQQGLRLWGHARHIHLLPDARRFFPELAALAPQIQANGKYKLAVDVAGLGAGRLRHMAEQALVCLVQRAAGTHSALEPIAPQQVIDALCRRREPGFDLFAATEPLVDGLARGGAYRLHVGSNLAHAVALLRELTDLPAGRAA